MTHSIAPKKDVWKKMKMQTLLILILTCILTGCSALGGSTNNGITAAASGSTALNAIEETEVPAVKGDPLWTDEASLTAMIISDLHYTEYKEVDPQLVPGISMAQEITDAIVSEVIDKHPDVFIMTGDNTNGGYSGDVSGLVKKLQKIRDNSIEIILTTGNHDFDLMDPKGFEEAYFGLLDPVDRDPASLSYTAIVKDVVFLAMDDNAVVPGGAGIYSPETMQWLRTMLEKYKDRTVIFLSHHNVLYGFGEENSSSHLIQNPELPELLQNGGVKLAMTGHMHFPYISQMDGLWEILSGMPFSGSHLIGNLAVGEGRMIYYAEPIDFASYGGEVDGGSANGSSADARSADAGPANAGPSNAGSLKEELERLDKESAAYMDQVFGELLDKEGLRGSKKKKVIELIGRYFLYYNTGTLASHAQEIKDDPSYDRMIKALWNYNYGPWMQAMVEKSEYNARELEITW